MAAKKKKSGTATKTRTVYVTPKRTRSRKKSGVSQIPAAAATVGLVASHMNSVDYMLRNPNLHAAKETAKYLLKPEEIKKSLIGAGVGYLAGVGIKKFAPKIIKTPAGKLAKKIPRVF